MAAPLESSHSKSRSAPPPPPPPTEARPSPSPEENPNQKLGLLNALFSVGALRPAFAILSKFPWLVDSNSEIADLILRILTLSITPLFSAQFPPREERSGFSRPKARYGPSGIITVPERKPQLTLKAPTPLCTASVEFVFFFRPWADRVPMCHTFDDLSNVVEPILRFIGLHISRDTMFLTKFVRLGRQHLVSLLSYQYHFYGGSLMRKFRQPTVKITSLKVQILLSGTSGSRLLGCISSLRYP